MGKTRINYKEEKNNRKTGAFLLRVFALALCFTGFIAFGAGKKEIAAQDDIPKGPQLNADASQVAYTNVYFGSYPQEEVKGADLTAKITGADYDSYGDAVVDGVKYHRLKSGQTNNDEQFGNSAYRYFKWRRIRWRVLANDGKTLYLMADGALDCQSYHNVGEAVTWEDSFLRKWLNSSFYRTAFSEKERQAIVSQAVDNQEYVTAGGAENSVTNDLIYLLSLPEMGKTEYGFPAAVQNASPCRQMAASDYAYAMGARLGAQDGSGDQCCWWWLRSPAVEEENALRYAALINHTGAFTMYGLVENPYRGVVPVLHISIDSHAWLDSDDGTSGSGGGESASVPLTVGAPNMQRSQNVAAFDVEAKGGLAGEYDYQWYYAPSETGGGHPISESDYKSIVWQGKALYIDLKADDVPDGLYLYCAVNDGRTTVESSRIWFSKQKKSQKITYQKGSIENQKLAYGASFHLNAKCNGAGASISYKSSDPKVLSVTKDGKLKAKGYGKATVTITASDSPVDEYGKTEKKLTLTVVPKQVKLSKVTKEKNSQGRVEGVYVKWKKDSSIDGCQYNIAYNKSFTHSTNGEKEGQDNFMRLRYLDISKDKLYIRVRAYKKSGKKTYYGKWSKSYIVSL